MNGRIRRVGFAVGALFAVLVLQLTYLQVVAADRLANDPRNVRKVIRDYSQPRGSILTADDQVVARSAPVSTQFQYQRQYPLGALFGHVSGYFSFTYGATGVEATYNSDLAGRSHDLQYRDLRDLLIGKEHTGTVVLTIRSDIQQAAKDALAGRRGSVVAVDPKTGAILALYSEPSFDPTPLAGHDQSQVRAAYTALAHDPNNPMLARAWRERYPPGSAFKIVTAATAIERGVANPSSRYPVVRELALPQTTNTLKNFGGESCGGSLVDSFRRSCNTTFGRIGLQLGDTLVDGMNAFGVGDPVPLDVAPPPARSAHPEAGTFKYNKPNFAFAAIGQGDVAVTPLQMALVAAGIANGGVIMKPYVVAEIRDIDGAVVRRANPSPWRQATSPETASTVRDLMVAVVQSGTGTLAQIPGVAVAGKTGTAQAPGGPPHTWFVGFAPAENPQVAFAVIVERGGNAGDEATGGRVAAPVAKAVVQAILRAPPPPPAAPAAGGR